MQAVEPPVYIEDETPRGVVDSNGNWYPTMPTIEEQNRDRNRQIYRLWGKYCRGQLKTFTGRQASFLRMVSGDEIQVFPTYHAFSNELIRVEVLTKSFDNHSSDMNIIGYNHQERCFAFKGQAVHFTSFYALAQIFGEAQKISRFYKSPPTIEVPHQGLQPHLTYQQFAGQVVVIECAAWMSEDVSQHADIMKHLDFLRNITPLSMPSWMNLDGLNLDLQQVQTDENESSIGEPTPSPSLQLDEGSETHEQGQFYLADSASVGDPTFNYEENGESFGSTTSILPTFVVHDIDASVNERLVPASDVQTPNSSGHTLEEQAKAIVSDDARPIFLDTIDEDEDQPVCVDNPPGSPWSLFGENGEEYEMAGASTCTGVDIDSERSFDETMQEQHTAMSSPMIAPVDQDTMPSEQQSSAKEAVAENKDPTTEKRHTSPEKQNTFKGTGSTSEEAKSRQEEHDARLAAQLERTDRYSFRRRTPSVSLGESLEWIKSSKASPRSQSAHSTKGKSVAKVMKPKKRGVGKKTKRRY